MTTMPGTISEKETPAAAYAPIQEGKTIQASQLTLAGGIRAVVDRAGVSCKAKGLRVNYTKIGDYNNGTPGSAPSTSAAAVDSGVLCIHEVDDLSAAGAKQYTFYELKAGDKEGVRFDEILESHTTIDLAQVKILL